MDSPYLLEVLPLQMALQPLILLTMHSETLPTLLKMSSTPLSLFLLLPIAVKEINSL
jgi:hypothetical protein